MKQKAVYLRWLKLPRLSTRISLAVTGSGLALLIAYPVGVSWARVVVAGLGLVCLYLLTLVLRRTNVLVRLVPPLSPGGLGLFRVAFGLALLYALPALSKNIIPGGAPEAFQRERTLTDLGIIHRVAANGELIEIIENVTAVALVVFTLGFLSRTAYAVATMGLVVLVHVYVTIEGGGHDWGLPSAVLVLLLVVPWHRGIGIDSTIRRIRGRDSEWGGLPFGLALWLPGLMLGLAWLAAAHSKFVYSGHEWATGGAVRYHFVEDAASAHSDIGLWIASHERLSIAMSGAGVLFEALFFLNVFARNTWIRAAFGLAAAGFFLSTVLFQGVVWVAWWALLLAFVPWNGLAARIARMLPEYVVLIDGACPLCRRTARVLHSLDWFDRVRFVDSNDDEVRAELAPGLPLETALASMPVRRPRDGRLWLGYDAYVALARSLPLLWPFALLGLVPPVSTIGRAVYGRIAAARIRVPCTDVSCDPILGRAPALPVGPSRIQATIGLAACALVAALVVQQFAISGRRMEYQPLFSNYPMYSGTFESTDEFDRIRQRKLSRFEYRRPDGSNVTPLIVALNGDEDLLDLIYELRGSEIPRESVVRKVESLRVEYMRVHQQNLDRLLVTVDERAFDWDSGTFVWRSDDAHFAEVDLRTRSLVSR